MQDYASNLWTSLSSDIIFIRLPKYTLVVSLVIIYEEVTISWGVKLKWGVWGYLVKNSCFIVEKVTGEFMNHSDLEKLLNKDGRNKNTIYSWNKRKKWWKGNKINIQPKYIPNIYSWFGDNGTTLKTLVFKQKKIQYRSTIDGEIDEYS